MEKTYCVYKHTNKINGKVYIGITYNKPEVRWGNNGIGYKRQKFWNAIQKYGWDNFDHEILFENLSDTQAYEKEIELIALYDSTNKEKGYNIALGGVDGRTTPLKKIVYQYSYRGNFIRSYESTMEVQRVNGFDCNAVGMCCRKGIEHTSFGYRWSYEWLGEEIAPDDLRTDWQNFVWCYDVEGNFIKQYFSVIEAEKETGIRNSAIIGCCTGKYTNTKGLRWFYEFQGEKIDAMPHKVGTDGRICCSNKTSKQKDALFKSQKLYKSTPVYQYDRHGTYIQKFNSIQDAVDEGYSDVHSIEYACRSNTTTGGFYWDYKKLDIKNDIHVNKNQTRNKYIQYDLSHNFIAEYSCLQDIKEALGVKSVSFTNKTSRGFIWEVVPLEKKEEREIEF